jgi:hypothetical protein
MRYWILVLFLIFINIFVGLLYNIIINFQYKLFYQIIQIIYLINNEYNL